MLDRNLTSSTIQSSLNSSLEEEAQDMENGRGWLILIFNVIFCFIKLICRKTLNQTINSVAKTLPSVREV